MKVNILPDVYKKIMFYVDISTVEVSLMGKVTKSGNTLTVRSVHIAKQFNTGVETEMQPEDLGRLLYETREEEGELNCWIHSHVNMGVSRSGTDVDTGIEMGANGYCLALIFNKRRQVNCTYYQGETADLPSLILEKIPVSYENEVSDVEHSSWEADFKKYCQPKPITRLVPKGTEATAENFHTFPIVKGETLTGVEDGAIHLTNHDLRYNEFTGFWVSYYDYWVKHNSATYVNNLLDLNGTRTEAIKSFIAMNGVVPANDYVLEEFYTELNDLNALEFYIHLEDEEGQNGNV